MLVHVNDYVNYVYPDKLFSHFQHLLEVLSRMLDYVSGSLFSSET